MFDPNQTLIGVVELSKGSWLVAGIIPGVERQPLKKLAPDEDGLLKLHERWRAEAENAGHKITRIAVAFETGRDGLWLARWLRARGIEAHVIHAASVPVSREHRTCQDRPARHRAAQALISRLAAWRSRPSMPNGPTASARTSLASTPASSAIKSTLARLGIRGFNPTLKEAPERLEHLRTPEGEPIPPNTLAELKRDMERKQFVAEQIGQIEKARLEQLK